MAEEANRRPTFIRSENRDDVQERMGEEANRRTTPSRSENRDNVQQRNREILKVSTRSRPSAVAGAIAGSIRDNDVVEIQTIGAGAANQAIKAIVIARNYLREEGIEIGLIPFFIDVVIDGEDRTALRLVVERLPGDPTISAPPPPPRKPETKGK